MFQVTFNIWLLIATMLHLSSLLDHEKSFLVHDAAAVVYSICVHKGSILKLIWLSSTGTLIK